MKTLNDFFELYLELYAPSRAVHTIRTYRANWDKHIKMGLGLIDVGALTFIDYQKFANGLLDNLEPKSVKNILALLSCVHGLALKGGVATSNPVQFVELPRFDNRRYFRHDLEMQRHILQSMINYDEEIYRHIFIVLLHGRRLGEVLKMEWKNINLAQNVYYVPAVQNKSRKNLEFGITKLLREVFLKQADITGECEYVFINQRTKEHFKGIKRAWKRFKSKNGIPESFRVHDVRHLVGTYSINTLGQSIEQVSQTLGHSSIQVTQRYVTSSANNSKYVVSNMLESVT